MKRVNNLYDFSLKEITDMYFKIRSKVKNKNKITNFEDFLSINICHIKDLLDSRSYKNISYNIFLIKEPKYRIIMSTNLNDKVINHLVAYKMLPVLEKSLIDTNIATRLNKGTSYGINYLKSSLNKMSGTIYALKFDISKYFYNIDHDLLFNLIQEKIKDHDFLILIKNILDSTDDDHINRRIIYLKEKALSKTNNKDEIEEIKKIPLYRKGKGLPIGNMTSQLLAIFYLNKIDHFIKEDLHIKYYIRYMDDGVILFNDKEYLNYCLSKIIFALDKFNLSLNLPKTKIINVSKNGLDFLGYRFYKDNNVYLKLREKTRKRFIVCKNDLSKLPSYLGFFLYGNCHDLIFSNISLHNKKIIDKINKKKN